MPVSFTQGTSCLLRWVRNIDDELHALIAGKSEMCELSNEIPVIKVINRWTVSGLGWFTLFVSFPFFLVFFFKASWLACPCSSTKAHQYPCIFSQSWWR